MPMYKYHVVDPEGNVSEDSMAADSARDLVAILEERGYQVSSVELAEQPRRLLRRKSRLTWEDLALLNEQLLAITKSGLPLAPSVEALARDVKNPRLRPVLDDIRRQLEAGHTLGEAFDRHPESFSPMYRAIIRAGERAGNLSEVLSLLFAYSTRTLEFKNRLHEAIAYPLFVLIAVCLVLGFLLTNILPIFAEIFGDFGAQLPALTVFWLRISMLIRHHFIGTALVLVIAVVIARVAFRLACRHEPVRYALHRVAQAIPAYGRLFAAASLARFTRSLGLLLSCQVPLPQSLDLASHAAGNAVLRKAVNRAAPSITGGERISAALEDTGFFPHMFCWMLATGEERGTLDQTLLSLADSYDSNTDRLSNLVVVFITPALIIIAGAVIGSVIIGLYMPIFSLADTISGA